MSSQLCGIVGSGGRLPGMFLWRTCFVPGPFFSLLLLPTFPSLSCLFFRGFCMVKSSPPRYSDILACLKLKVMEPDGLGPKTLKPGQTDIFSFKLRLGILPLWKADWQTISTFHLSFGNKLNNLFSFLSYKIFSAYNYFSWNIVDICLFVFVF